jgi:hypothetical protein
MANDILTVLSSLQVMKLLAPGWKVTEFTSASWPQNVWMQPKQTVTQDQATLHMFMQRRLLPMRNWKLNCGRNVERKDLQLDSKIISKLFMNWLTGIPYLLKRIVLL